MVTPNVLVLAMVLVLGMDYCGSCRVQIKECTISTPVCYIYNMWFHISDRCQKQESKLINKPKLFAMGCNNVMALTTEIVMSQLTMELAMGMFLGEKCGGLFILEVRILIND